MLATLLTLRDVADTLEAFPAVYLAVTAWQLTVSAVPPLKKVSSFLLSPLDRFLAEDDLYEFDSKNSTIIPPLWKSFSVVFVAAVQAAGWTCKTAVLATTQGLTDSFTRAILTASAWTLVALMFVVRPPTRPPYLALLLASLQLTSTSIHIWKVYALQWDLIAELSILACFVGIAVSYPVQDTVAGPRVAKTGKEPSNHYTSPEDSVNLVNWLSFRYVQPLLDLANKQTLNEENVCSNSLDLIIAFAVRLYKAFAGFIPPYALQQILAALESREPNRRSDAYLYGLLAFVANCSFAQFDLFEAWHSRRAYERTRGQLFCALHWKSLKRRDMQGKTEMKKDGPQKGPRATPEESGSTSDIGRVVNLMTGDAYAVAQRFWEFPAVFVAPVRLTISLIFLYNILGWSCFAGVAVVLLAYAVNYPLALLNVSLTRKSWAAKDSRMSLVNEFFQSIRFLKYMGWESQWMNRVRKVRNQELGIRVKQNFVDILITFIWNWIPIAVVLVSFLCYTMIAKEELTVSKAFTSIEVFSQLEGPMTELPDQIFALLHAYVSMQRIVTFLEEDEVEDWATALKRQPSDPSPPTKPTHVELNDASFIWYTKPESTRETPAADSTASNEISNTFMLQELSVSFPPGKLSLITGATGSGKTSVLNALLGEMLTVSGSVTLDKSNHNVAYASQLPWLEHATIRDNILFRTPFDEARYNAVLEYCALKPDLAIFEAGDMTEIGEKGVSLSGGQRARVALARAVYSRANVVLLDDPLAAVDMHTAKHLVEKCFQSPLMKDRTILLVTHHVSLCLPVSAYILELSNGRIYRQGSVQDFSRRGELETVIAEEDHPREGDETDEEAKVQNEADANNPFGSLPRPKASGKLVEAEHRAEGRVSLKTYLTYMKASGWLLWFTTFLMILFIRAVTIGSQYFLAQWAQAYDTSSPNKASWIASVSQQLLLNVPLPSKSFPIWDLPSPSRNVMPWLVIYAALSVANGTGLILYLIAGYWASLNASRLLFTAMLNRVSRAPSRFFDKTPIGRILNRFTADIGAVDGALMFSVRRVISRTLNFVTSFAVIVITVPSFAPLALAIAAVYILLAPPYVKTARDLRRLESVFLSPAFSGFDELLHGLTHVRAFGMEFKFQERFYAIVDKFQGFDHFYWMASYWMKERYDYLGSIIVYLTTLFALWTEVSEGLAAVVIVNAGMFAEASRQLVQVFAQLELDFNSIERIGEYLDVEQEAPAISNKRPPAYWPSSNGGIVVENLVIRYAPNLPTVLKGVSFEVKPREKVGVVGRTGSGKSTLAMSLLRIIEPEEGRIILDGVIPSLLIQNLLI
ncbi:hypothetical protein FRB99_008669 [Tulasnella sp. 403]|nr:hypothetical protein FRB99_008669 [Tulasnella sp. 403]